MTVTAAHSTPTDVEGGHSLRGRVAETRWRQRIAGGRAVNGFYRLVLGTVGGTVVMVGIVTIPLPGPGWLTVFGGLFVLATEFAWAERLLAFSRHQVSRWTAWLARQPLWARGCLGLLSVVVGYGVFVVTLQMVGVPGWVPTWVPLWR